MIRMNAFRNVASAGSLLVTLCLSSGCMLNTGAPPPANRYYDLGIGLPGAANCSYDVSIGSIETQPHLQSTKMWYRHADAPFELAAYAVSRWVAPPAQMLRQRLRSAFQHDLHRTSRSAPLMKVTLQLQISRMELAIHNTKTDSATISNAGENQPSAFSIITLSAKIITDGEQSGTQRFHLQEAASVSPAGEAEAMARALDKLPAQLCQWLVDRKRGPIAAKL